MGHVARGVMIFDRKSQDLIFASRCAHASAMKMQGVGLHLTQLKVKQLVEELAEREASRSGRKRALQLELRLRALIIAVGFRRIRNDFLRRGDRGG